MNECYEGIKRNSLPFLSPGLSLILQPPNPMVQMGERRAPVRQKSARCFPQGTSFHPYHTLAVGIAEALDPLA